MCGHFMPMFGSSPPTWSPLILENILLVYQLPSAVAAGSSQQTKQYTL